MITRGRTWGLTDGHGGGDTVVNTVGDSPSAKTEDGEAEADEDGVDDVEDDLGETGAAHDCFGVGLEEVKGVLEEERRRVRRRQKKKKKKRKKERMISQKKGNN